MANPSKLKNHNFYQINTLSKISKKLLQEAENQSKWMEYFNFLVKVINEDIINKDDFLKALKQQHDFTCYVLKLPPFVSYNWHKDTKRNCSINMLLNFDGISHCLFADRFNDVVFDICELNYQENTYYLFNTQNYHSVINLEKPRFLLSLEFKNQSLTYDDLLKTIRSLDGIKEGNY